MMAIVLKGTVILAAAFAAAGLLRRRSAALRHFVWTGAFAALLLLPVLAWRIPNVPVVASEAAVPQVIVSAVSTAVAAPGPAAPRIPWLAFLYAAGCALAAARFLFGALRTSWMLRRAIPAPQLGDDVLAAPDVPMPLAWGLLRRRVVLPAAALGWPEARLRSVVLHERMHHLRRDLPAQAVAQAGCCLFWFHPLAWMALGRQRAERERACDDAVLKAGVAPHDYAAHLVEVVRSVAGRRRSWADAPAMAEASNLESRVRALLDGGRDRRPLTRRTALAVAAALAAVLVPLAALQVHAQAAAGTISGIVRDPSGARVPGCRVTLKSADGVHQETTTSGAAGEYRFSAIPVGRYALEFGARGFKLDKMDTELVAGATANVDANLEVGQISETVSVTGRKPGAAVPRATAPVRIPVGGNVQAARLIRQTRPVYAEELQAAGVEGTVMIRAVISKDGHVLNPQVVNTAIDPRLAKAALDAVSQWLYQPTLLNGQPVEVVTTVSVGFHLEQ